MPPLFATTSAIAAAATRILAAYLSNHKLSPTEAAHVSGTIVEALGRLVTDAAAVSASAVAPVPESVPAKRRRARQPSRAAVIAAEEAEAPILLPAVLLPAVPSPPALSRAVPPPESSPESPAAELTPAEQPEAEAPEPMAPRPESRAFEPPRIEPIAVPPSEPRAAEPRAADGPRFESLPLFADDGEAADLVPHKRKRPSRPRSKRGKGPASTAEFLPGAEREDAEPDDEHAAAATPTPVEPAPVALRVERETAEEPVAVTEEIPLAAKKRGRPRRVPTT